MIDVVVELEGTGVRELNDTKHYAIEKRNQGSAVGGHLPLKAIEDLRS